MKREDILHLSELARIELSEAEIERFGKEFDSILEYVDSIKSLAKAGDAKPTVGPLHSVVREDRDPHEPGVYTEDILALAPKRKGQYVQVKKILGTDYE